MAAIADVQQRFSAGWESFFRTTRRLRARAGRFPGELTLPQYHLLEALREDSELPVGELADRAGVAPPTATRMLDCLARDGFVERRHSESDRRSVLVRLTDRGEAAVANAHDVIEAWRREVFERLQPEEREPAARLLARLAEVLEEEL
ncbi:MAG TPA: MarR family transcriptional regulator [Solirubrobacteraceae bacterium]|nr:MarR family transcriptional regulator [Solirubrobacteraceae bacterium]